MIDDNSSNIIYLPKIRQSPVPGHPPVNDSNIRAGEREGDQSFKATILKNRLNGDRLQKERLKSNKAILKSYRLK